MARSAEFLLPRQLSELVLGGMELGDADDKVQS
jgi:non-canonical (house-cleaning) NTP pyrophosphatase